jgi:hypothetical protein
MSNRRLSIRNILGVGFLGLVVVACKAGVSPGVSSSALPSEPQFNFANGPESPGRVFRFSIGGFFFFVWNNADLLAINSTNNAVLNFALQECAETTALTPFDWQDVVTPEAVRTLVQAEESYVYVFDWQPEWFNPLPPTCQSLLDHLIAQGRAKFQYNDNDLFLTGPGANAASLRSDGRLEDLLNGGVVHYHLNVHALFVGDEFRILKKDIVLNPDPREG